MLIKMDSEAFVAASLLWVDLIVIHHKTSDTLRLALYQIIGRNWQNYEQGIMSQPHISCKCKEVFVMFRKIKGKEVFVTIFLHSQ